MRTEPHTQLRSLEARSTATEGSPAATYQLREDGERLSRRGEKGRKRGVEDDGAGDFCSSRKGRKGGDPPGAGSKRELEEKKRVFPESRRESWASSQSTFS
ncbi:hypothetical protein CDL15_Pgr005238 [Punica granatum]|uniref:Uncharacterized protein n=1 Tax=Punica granatum TaxID=22663 RepID=A0A218WQB5_PUNGR|nr:hypothetical protein CDL15_Pgr005238 [Punica granatum]